MRAIEKQLVAAIRTGSNFCKSNTMYNAETGQVFLHGNLIAEVETNQLSESTATPIRMHWTLAGWPTVTTRSRLNALGADLFGGWVVCQERGEQVNHNGDVVNPDSWYTCER